MPGVEGTVEPSARGEELTLPLVSGVAGERGAASLATADIGTGVNEARRRTASASAENMDSARSLPVETVAVTPSNARLATGAEQAGVDGREAIRNSQGKAPPAAEGAKQGRQEGSSDMLRGFQSVPWKAYATDGQILTITAAHMAHNWGLYVMLAWLPTYFSQVRRELRGMRYLMHYSFEFAAPPSSRGCVM